LEDQPADRGALWLSGDAAGFENPGTPAPARPSRHPARPRAAAKRRKRARQCPKTAHSGPKKYPRGPRSPESPPRGPPPRSRLLDSRKRSPGGQGPGLSQACGLFSRVSGVRGARRGGGRRGGGSAFVAGAKNNPDSHHLSLPVVMMGPGGWPGRWEGGWDPRSPITWPGRAGVKVTVSVGWVSDPTLDTGQPT